MTCCPPSGRARFPSSSLLWRTRRCGSSHASEDWKTPSGALRWPAEARASVSLDLEAYDNRRSAMLALLQAAAGLTSFSAWIPYSEAIGRSRSEKLEQHLKVLYGLLRDLLILRESGGEIRNRDVRRELEAIAGKLTFAWLRAA